jgi:hypothetical protein
MSEDRMDLGYRVQGVEFVVNDLGFHRFKKDLRLRV